MSTTRERDARIADALRLELRLDADRTKKMLSETFWQGRFGIHKKTATRVDAVRQLLQQRGIAIQAAETFGTANGKSWLTLRLTDVEPWPDDEWFERMKSRRFESEAEVEYFFALKLIEALDYQEEDLSLQRVVHIPVGSGKPVRSRADVVVYDGEGRERPMFVLEVKQPGSIITPQIVGQVESYAFWLKAPAWVITNADETRLYVHGPGNEHVLKLSVQRAALKDAWTEVVRHLSRESMVTYCRQFQVPIK